MRTGNRRPVRSRKTSGTPPDSENPPQKREGQRPGGNFRRKSEGGYTSGPRKSGSAGRKPYGDKPYSRPGKPYSDRKKSFDKPDGRPDNYRDQKDKPAFKKDGDDKPHFRRESAGGRPPYRREGASERTGFRKDDGRDKRFRKEGEKSFGGRSGGFKKPYGTRDGDKREASPADAPKWNRKEKHEFYGDRKRKFSKNPYRKNTNTQSEAGSEPAVSDGSIRLNKYISNAGICSRREADELIAAGVISVNGNIITTLGYKVQPGDIVKYNDAKLKSEKPVYLLLNKPKDFITTVDDPQNRNTVMSLIRNACKERVYPVGRLDRNTTGLLLFTNDGDLADKLTHPSFEIQKVYEVHLDKNLKREDFEAISEGVQLEDGMIRPDEISYSSESKSIIGIELHSGRNRIVRRIFEHFGYRVVKLDRVLYAGLTKKDLPRSKWRFLTDMELANLKMMTGNKKFKAAPKRISLAEE